MAPTHASATGVWTAQSKNNAKQGRQLLQAWFQNNDTTPLNGTRSGVHPTTWDVANTRFTDLLVLTTSGLSMSVAPGWGVAHRSGQGPYFGLLDSQVTVTCDTAPASNPRNDLVIMRMYDAALSDTVPNSGTTPCRIELVTGTPAASPVDPMTVNALGVYTGFADGFGGVGIPLARAQVSTAGVITLTRLRRSTGVAGAVRQLLEGDSGIAGAAGELVYSPSTDTLAMVSKSGSSRTLAQGVIARGERTTATGSANPVSAMRLDNVPLLANHVYDISTSNVNLFGTANDTVSMEIWFSNVGAATTGSGRLPGARSEVKLVNGGGAAGQAQCATTYLSAVDQTVSFLVGGERNTGSGNVQLFADSTSKLILTVTDLGINPTSTVVIL